MKIQMPKLKCLRCNHEWIPRKLDGDVRKCPACQSAYWDTPRQPESVWETLADEEVGR